ncbi:hypothetical protein [Pseudomonas qingdaonensis]|uniref:hypothetical protein n=1 Tax=Pseudomonas qingdaonensis TaxID=2056231 RepID=UPI001F2AC731|nr:hypothetical protein [Pseudomonas qingdaonensis]
MSIAEELFYLFDKEDKYLGQIILQVGDNPKKQGRFSPVKEFSRYRNLFKELESAANAMLFSHVDEIEEKIALLGFYVKAEGSEIKLKIKGLQIMRGWAIFEVGQAR